MPTRRSKLGPGARPRYGPPIFLPGEIIRAFCLIPSGAPRWLTASVERPGVVADARSAGGSALRPIARWLDRMLPR